MIPSLILAAVLASSGVDTSTAWRIGVDALHDIERHQDPAATTTITALYGVGAEPVFDIPISEVPSVERWVRHFQGRGRARFARWLSRATRWAPIYYDVLEANALPKDLLFLSMVESGFSNRAYSWAHAAGLWQIMPRTGRRFGLTVGFWVDERRDFVRSSHAAARYLSILYAEFGDWPLAFAAYNAGEARVRRAIRRSGTRDFWQLVNTRYLPRETRRYVPKIIAAAKVAKNLERYGIEVSGFEPPIEWEVVTVTVATDLQTIAQACDVTEEALIDLNRALYRRVTPPGRSWDVRVPRWRGAACQRGLQAVDPSTRRSYRFHVLSEGEDATQVAKRYHTTVDSILAHNRIEAAKFSEFEAMVIPIPFAEIGEVPIRREVASWIRSPPYTPGSPAVRIHRVRRGESLWRIANRYRVRLRQLRAWNGLWRTNHLRIGQRLVIRGRGG